MSLEVGQHLWQYVYDGVDVTAHECVIVASTPMKTIRYSNWVYLPDRKLTVERVEDDRHYKYYIPEDKVDSEVCCHTPVYMVVLTEHNYDDAKRIFSDYFIERKAKCLEQLDICDLLMENLRA